MVGRHRHGNRNCIHNDLPVLGDSGRVQILGNKQYLVSATKIKKGVTTMPNKTKEYKYNVEIIKEGQPKPYADSEYVYIITSGCGEYNVKAFCTKILKPKNQEYKDWCRYSADSYFKGYYTFEKTSENTYKYRVVEPFCD